MATDHSQNIDVVGKKELGWVVPRVLEPGQTVDADGWQDTKRDTNRIDWKQPDGTPYTLTGAGVHNGEAYVAPLPRPPDHRPVARARPATTSGGRARATTSAARRPAATTSTSRCPALRRRSRGNAGDADLQVALGHRVGLRLRLRARDHRQRQAATRRYASANGYTTPASQNPNANGCQSQYGNGLTGSSGSYDGGHRRPSTA